MTEDEIAGAQRLQEMIGSLLQAASSVGPAAGATGFSGAGAGKPDEHVAHLLELYTRCLEAVEGKSGR